jgi:hypothetical protein
MYMYIKHRHHRNHARKAGAWLSMYTVCKVLQLSGFDLHFYSVSGLHNAVFKQLIFNAEQASRTMQILAETIILAPYKMPIIFFQCKIHCIGKRRKT